MSVLPIAGPSSSSPDLSDQVSHKPHSPIVEAKPLSTTPVPPPPPSADQVELSERVKVSQLVTLHETASQIAAHLGLSISIVKSDLFPTDTTSSTTTVAIDLNA